MTVVVNWHRAAILSPVKPARPSRAALDCRDTASEFEREGLTQWDFGDLPETLTITRTKADDRLPRADGYGRFRRPDAAGHRRSRPSAKPAGVMRLLRFELKEHLNSWKNPIA